MKILHFVAYSGAGKTGIIEKIIKDLSNDFNIVVVKHDAHDKIYDKSLHLSQPEIKKDSERYTESGAKLSFIISKSLLLIEGDVEILKNYIRDLEIDEKSHIARIDINKFLHDNVNIKNALRCENEEYKILYMIFDIIQKINKKTDLIIIEGYKELSYNIKDANILKNIINIGLKRIDNKKDFVYNEEFYDIIVTDDKNVSHKNKFDFDNKEELSSYIKQIINKEEQ